jgi:hypothetical protein
MAENEGNDDSIAKGEPERGIFHGFSGYKTPTKEDWRSVLTSGLIVVDTNVLLNLYRYNQDARTSLLETLQKFGDRLWVPHQVMDEFWRNRESALEDSARQLEQSVASLRVNLDKSISDLRHWVNRVSLDRASAARLEGAMKSALDQVVAEMQAVVDSSGVEMEEDTSRDSVVSALSDLLHGKVGSPLYARDHAAAVIEGKRRVEEQIPPGYKDKKKQVRGDDTEVGDYLVWRQLISESKARNVDVLLITGDTKEDWWRTRNRIPVGPRNELAEELLREAGVGLYMLKPDRLLTYARDFLQVSVSEDSVQNVEMVDSQSETDDAFQQLEKLVEGGADSAVLQAWSEVEAATEKALPKFEVQRSWTGTAMARELFKQRLVSLETVSLVEHLAKIRNEIMHGRSVRVGPEEAKDFISSAKDVVVTLSHLANISSRARLFEQNIAAIIRTAGFDVFSTDVDSGIDFLVASKTLPKNAFALQVKYSSNRPFGSVSATGVLRLLSMLPDHAPSLLVVTNAPLTREAEDILTRAALEEGVGTEGHSRIEVVRWRNSEDDSLITRALKKLAR